jgi:hypothetical protein
VPRYPLGQPVRLSTTVFDITGAPADPTTLTLSITLAGGTATTVHWPTPAEIVKDGTGLFHYDYTAGAAGRHGYVWTAVGTAAGVQADVFDVIPVAPPLYVIALADAKDHLGITSSEDDDELRRTIEAATAVVEWKVGPVVARTFVDLVPCGGYSIWLPHRPIVSLTSVVPVTTGGAADAAGELDFDPGSGRVWRMDGGPVQPGQRWTYVAGRVEVQANVAEAAEIIVRHLWETQRGGANTPARILGAEPTTLIPSLGFAVPNRAIELLAPDAHAPFMA